MTGFLSLLKDHTDYMIPQCQPNACPNRNLAIVSLSALSNLSYEHCYKPLLLQAFIIQLSRRWTAPARAVLPLNGLSQDECKATPLKTPPLTFLMALEMKKQSNLALQTPFRFLPPSAI